MHRTRYSGPVISNVRRLKSDMSWSLSYGLAQEASANRASPFTMRFCPFFGADVGRRDADQGLKPG